MNEIMAITAAASAISVRINGANTELADPNVCPPPPVLAGAAGVVFAGKLSAIYCGLSRFAFCRAVIIILIKLVAQRPNGNAQNIRRLCAIAKAVI